MLYCVYAVYTKLYYERYKWDNYICYLVMDT